jgi:hypothetical protein
VRVSKWRAEEWKRRIEVHDKTVPQQVWDDIEYEIARNELACADNLRAYRYGDREGEQIFRYLEKKGCCGSWNGSTMVDGWRWIIGCNYGHILIFALVPILELL